MAEEFPEGTKVYHRLLRLKGVVAKPVGLGVDKGWTTLVDFEDGEAREVSSHLLDREA